MPATPAWLASAEAMLNRNIAASAQAAALARRLQGTSLQVDIGAITRIRASVAGRPAGAARRRRFAGGCRPCRDLCRRCCNCSRASAVPRCREVRGEIQRRRGSRRPVPRSVHAARARIPRKSCRAGWAIFRRAACPQFAHRTLEFARPRAAHRRREHRRIPAGRKPRPGPTAPSSTSSCSGVDALRDTADRIEARLVRLEAQLPGAA